MDELESIELSSPLHLFEWYWALAGGSRHLLIRCVQYQVQKRDLVIQPGLSSCKRSVMIDMHILALLEEMALKRIAGGCAAGRYLQLAID